VEAHSGGLSDYLTEDLNGHVTVRDDEDTDMDDDRTVGVSVERMSWKMVVARNALNCGQWGAAKRADAPDELEEYFRKRGDFEE